MGAQIIGRQREIKILQKIKSSTVSEFVAIYGRRRVGKTYLIRQMFEKEILFQLTGLANAKLQWQLENFRNAMMRQNPAFQSSAKPNSWLAAFQQIIDLVEQSNAPKKILFLDELPWLDTPNSGFITTLEHFWNSWASTRKDVILIVCGSSASWIIHKLINNKGGLHNRVTKRIKLEPFTLRETELFLNNKGARYEQYQIAQIYMAMGGIPFYLDMIDPSLSAAQNINLLFFNSGAELRTEFNVLYDSLFKKAQDHIAVIEALATKAKGLNRTDLIKVAKLNNNGGTTVLLNELEECGFIRKYIAFGKTQRDQLYQLMDFYSLFFLRFVKNTSKFDENTWLNALDNPQIRAWSGYAFEMLCLHHLKEIKHQLGISGVLTNTSSWHSSDKKEKAQIDLMIDRRDDVINLCEMKFSIHEFTIDKAYAADLRNKIALFKEQSKTKKSLFFTMITTFGVRQNEYSGTFVQNSLVLKDLFVDIE